MTRVSASSYPESVTMSSVSDAANVSALSQASGLSPETGGWRSKHP